MLNINKMEKKYICKSCDIIMKKKEFSCYDMDFCSIVCMNKIIDPIRTKEKNDILNKNKNEKKYKHFDCGGAC
jgi:hypothetical protein